MRSSGLALAGANSFLVGRCLPENAEDGILTAEDVTTLNLIETDLVVLSACQTATGRVFRGEGVFGLRRAFFIAGARTVVMSLWKVGDEVTADLMMRFYKNLLKGMDKPKALRNAKLAMRDNQVPAWGWAAFVCEGDWHPLATVQCSKMPKL
jgi:CHAT domain-containing protein